MGAHKSVIATAVITTAIVGALTTVEPALSAGQQRPTAIGTPAVSLAIDALNDCIQKRFEEMDGRFGVSRVVNINRAPHAFEPESVSEMSAVRGLQQAGLRVVLYVTGLRVMRPTPSLPLVGELHARSMIKGPVLITSRAAAAGAPEPPSSSALWDDGRRAMKAFATADTYEFRQPGWTMTARAIRASKRECLQCHRETGVEDSVPNARPKLGDALGAVIYGYRAEP